MRGHKPGSKSCHYLPPGPQLPAQPSGVTTFRSVPCYTAWWQRHVGVRNLRRVFTAWARLRLKPTTSWLQVRHSNTVPRCHHNEGITEINNDFIDVCTFLALSKVNICCVLYVLVLCHSGCLSCCREPPFGATAIYVNIGLLFICGVAAGFNHGRSIAAIVHSFHLVCMSVVIYASGALQYRDAVKVLFIPILTVFKMLIICYSITVGLATLS